MRVIYILGKFRKNHDSNRQYGGKCEYHIQGEYFKTRSKRMELQGKYVHIAYITDHVHVHYVSENEISYSIKLNKVHCGFFNFEYLIFIVMDQKLLTSMLRY